MQGGSMTRIKQILKLALKLPSVATARALSGTNRSARFTGAYPTQAAALAALPASKQAGYDDASIADVSFDLMCQRHALDYPVVFWLDRLLPQITAVTDAGGHLGTKYIAFSGVLDLSGVNWVVYDLPGIIQAARARQKNHQLPAAIGFESARENLPNSDLLLASGLLQYLDQTFSDFVHSLPHRPTSIIVNKVALWDGPRCVTIERIGAGRVPYQIRNRAAFEAEIAVMGYGIEDQWDIEGLGHVIATHPWLGQSQSAGYVLKSLAD